MDADFGDVAAVVRDHAGVRRAGLPSLSSSRMVISFARSRRVLRDSGLDPLTARAQIAARVARGPLAAPAQSLEQRLSELDDLHRRGMITEAEYSAARTAALAALPVTRSAPVVTSGRPEGLREERRSGSATSGTLPGRGAIRRIAK